MKNVAFVTYNRVGDNLMSGWHEANDRRALVLQNTRGEKRLVSRDNPNPVQTRADEISTLWGQLQNEVENLDHVVIYVGAGGSEQAVELAAALPPAKVTFVGCGCGLDFKESMICAAGLMEAGRLLCECGGNRTMGKLFESFIQSGDLLPQQATA